MNNTVTEIIKNGFVGLISGLNTLEERIDKHQDSSLVLYTETHKISVCTSYRICIYLCYKGSNGLTSALEASCFRRIYY